MEPYEIIAAPFEVFVAPAGEPFPAVGADPAGNWALLGTSGKRSMHSDGVTITHDQTIERDSFRTLGTTGPRKASRVSEDLTVEFTLVDVSLEQYAQALDMGIYEDGEGAVKTEAGLKSMGLYRGLEVTELSLLVRGPSPYTDSLNSQYEIRRCYVDGSPSPVFAKGAPAGLLFRFIALVDTLGEGEGESQRFGRLIAAHTTPDINLTSLTENLTAGFVPAFTAGVYDYALAATNVEDSVVLVATLAGATITYSNGNGGDIVLSGVGYLYALEIGANVFTIGVAKVGYTTKVYTLTITRAA